MKKSKIVAVALIGLLMVLALVFVGCKDEEKGGCPTGGCMYIGGSDSLDDYRDCSNNCIQRRGSSPSYSGGNLSCNC